MRSLLTLPVLLALLLAAPASAQSFGLKGGLNVASFSGDDAVGSEARLGGVGGVTASFPLGQALDVQVEALYSQKGEEYFNTEGFSETTRLEYVEVPALLRFRLPASRTLDVGLSAGGYVGVPISGEVEVDGVFANELDLNTDYGALVGVDVGSGPFYVDARYSFGLTDAIEYDPGIDAFDLEKRNQVVSLTFGYRFGGSSDRRY